MSLSNLPSLLISPRDAWHAWMLERPCNTRSFAAIALPFTLLPPAMIVLWAHGIGAAQFPGVATATWELVALVFLVAELLSIFLMSWAIDASVRARGARSDMSGAFLVAAVAPLPLWLSSLALLQPSLLVAVLVPLAGLTYSAVLIRHGVRAMLGLQHIDCDRVPMRVIRLGLLNSLVLAGIVLVPLLLLA